jgi:hypothetical protein
MISKIYITAIAALALGSCGKDMDDPQEFSSAVVIHASPGTPGINVLADTVILNASPITFNQTIGYQGFDPGSRRVTIRNIASTGTTTYADLMNQTFEAGKAYSYFLYDTLINNQAKVLRLEDDLSLPAAGNVKVRFVHLAPEFGPLDVTFVRGTLFTNSSVTPNASVFEATDSVTISNVSPVGANPDTKALSAFREIRGGTGFAAFTGANLGAVPEANRNNRYVIKLKNAGTQTVVATSALTGINLTTGKAYTIYATGSVKKGQILRVNVFTNF